MPRTRAQQASAAVKAPVIGADGPALAAPGAARQKKSAKAKARVDQNMRRSISTPNLNEGTQGFLELVIGSTFIMISKYL